MRGPGLPGSPDFIQRIEGVGGPVSKGLFPSNYWSATGAGRRMLRRRRVSANLGSPSRPHLIPPRR